MRVKVAESCAYFDAILFASVKSFRNTDPKNYNLSVVAPPYYHLPVSGSTPAVWGRGGNTPPLPLLRFIIKILCRLFTVYVAAGWQDWAIFRQLGYFWRLIMIIWKDEVAQRNGDILGYFLFKQINYIFTEISSFRTRFVVGIRRFHKWFDVDVLGLSALL